MVTSDEMMTSITNDRNWDYLIHFKNIEEALKSIYKKQAFQSFEIICKQFQAINL